MAREEGRKTYFRRHLVLLSFGVTIFSWNLSSLRHTAIVPSYALYHSTTNEISAPPSYGIDSISIISNIVLVFTSILGAYAIDKWGLKSMIVGSFVLAVSAWFWYFSGQSFVLVLASQILAAVFGPIVTASILAISNRWYPPSERAKATAVASLIAILGAASALLVSPLFATAKNEIVELELKSCEVEKLGGVLLDKIRDAQNNNMSLACVDEFSVAKDRFCCYLPVDIERLNLMMGIISTVAFVFTAVCVKDRPPTPPAPSGEEKEYVNLWTGLKKLISSEGLVKLSISDFLISGPPLVAFTALARIFPAEVSEYSVIASAVGLVIGIPVSIFGGHILDKKQWYYSLTLAGYCTGTLAWLISTISLASGTLVGAYILLGMTTLSLTSYVAWQSAVYETKIEYVFDEKVPLEGSIVALDRTVINLSSIVFVSAIPPERVGGANITFYIGMAVMIAGCIPTVLIRNKYRYLRRDCDSSQIELENEEGPQS